MKLFAKKSLGQHFLSSSYVLKQIIEAADIKAGETVLEIGPGTGILTDALLDTGAKVIAVEKDIRVKEILEEKARGNAKGMNLEVMIGDILETDLTEFLPETFSIVANIPYYITGAILEKFLEHGPRPQKMILLVQKEVADRIVARDGKESILSISVKVFGTPTIIAKVPPGAFTPPPDVDSAVLKIENISDSPFSLNSLNTQRFFQIVRAGFAHKRKFLKRNLEATVSPGRIAEVWTGIGLDDKVRAEDIPPATWIEIARRVVQ